jgi:hypothetical protein
MGPFAVLNAILFGSAAAITFGLLGVIVIFLVLQGRHPDMLGEFATLWRSGLVFALMAAASGASLYATLKRLPWRHAAQAGMWLCLALLVYLYWPR